jgi:hypothetical protein
MDTEDKDAGAQAGPKGSSSGLNISLHPLVIINISDHATRKKSLAGGRPQRVLGILLGVQVSPCTSSNMAVITLKTLTALIDNAIKCLFQFLDCRKGEMSRFVIRLKSITSWLIQRYRLTWTT